ncbi:MAG TPA: hypothetical protein VGR28_05625 [Candidatus Thermoplasmatota archaeon]|jgi:hypothetical protein|nr:hypothetical protein [Candidatus Thermoplasmatota archaeon]
MRANGRARHRDRDEPAQVLILAGVVLILAFLLAAFAVGELAAEQQHLQRGPESDLPKLFREAREKLANTMAGLTYTAIDNATMLSRFNSSQAEMEQQARGRSVQLVVVLAGTGQDLASKTERENFTAGGGGCPSRSYAAVSYNNSRNYTGLAYDCGDDGIIYDTSQGRITGLVVHLVMADSTARLEETYAIAVN